MKRTRSVAAILVLVPAAAVAIGEEAPPAPSRVGPPVKEVKRAGLIVEVLPNGTCLAVKRAPTSGVVSVQFWVGAGSVTEGRWTGAGISHFVEHMIFEGTVREPGRGFDLLVRSLGGVHNGYTSLDRTVYHVTVPEAGRLEILDALVKLVREAGIPEERFEKERNVILQEIREGEDNPERLAGRLLRETIYRVHPYRYRIAGSAEAFSELTHADLVEYFQSRYVPGNQIVVLAGDLDVDEAARAARPLLSEAPAGPLPDLARRPEPEQLAPRFSEKRHPRARNARVVFAWRTVDLLHPDLFALDVLAMILGEGRASRLHQALREDTGLALSVGAYSWTPRDDGYLGVWVECEDDRVAEVRAAVELEVESVHKWLVRSKELDRAKSQVAAGLVFRRETAEGVARDLASDLLFTGDPDFSSAYLEGIRSVTAGDVMDAARRYLVPSGMSVAVFRPERETLAARAPEEVEGTGEKRRREPVVRPLPGGGTIVLVQDGSLPMVSVSATLLAGLRLEPDGEAGVSEMLAKVMQKGTKSHSARELADLIEGRGGNFGVVSGRNSLSVRVNMLSEDLETALDFAAEVLAEPRLDPADLEKVRAEQLAAIRARAERPWALVREMLSAELFAGHPYRHLETGTEASVASIARADLEGFHARIARRGNLVVAVAGDFVPSQASEMAEEAFRRMSNAEFRYESPAPANPPEGRTVVEKALPGSRSAVIFWGFPGPRMDTPDAHALALAAECLGGMSGRLWEAVRKEEGLAYAVGAFSSPQVDPGMFVLYVATRPEWEEKALSLLQKELRRFLDNPPEGEELERAKTSLAGEDAISLQSRGAMSLRAALYERYGLGARAAFDREGKLRKVTADDLARAAWKYLDPEGGVVAVVRPGESGERQ